MPKSKKLSLIKIKNFFKKHPRKLIVGFLCILIIVFILRNKKEDAIYETAVLKKGELIQTVSETGMVRASQKIDLSFGRTGKISKIIFDIGDSVKKGDVLARLDTSVLELQKKEAEAKLDIAHANLDKLLNGATNSELQIAKNEVGQAQANLSAKEEEVSQVTKITKENIDQAQENLDELHLDHDEVVALKQAIRIAEDNLANAKSTYSEDIIDNRQNAIITVEDKLSEANSALDVVERILENETSEHLLSVKNLSYLRETETLYSEAQDLIADTYELIKNYKDQTRVAQNILSSCLEALDKTFACLNAMYASLEHTITSADFSLTALDNFKSNINTQLANMSSAISTAQSMQQSLDSAILAYETQIESLENNLVQAEVNLSDQVKSSKDSLELVQLQSDQQNKNAQNQAQLAREALAVAEARYDKLLARARNEDIVLAEAQITQAQVAIDLIVEELKNAQIIAPLDGQIAKIEYEIGEQFSAGVVIQMISNEDYEIEVDVSEADINKVQVGQKVKIDFDALSDEFFDGIVDFIEPAETIIQDVIYYKVTIKLISPFSEITTQDNDKDDFVSLDFSKDEIHNLNAINYKQNIKPGMTANVVITTAQKDNVLLVPSRAIHYGEDQESFVKILKQGELQEQVIQIGLRGDLGMTEAIDGISEGAEIVTYIKKN